MSPAKTFFTKMIFIVIAVFISTQVLAASNEFCDRYARQALEILKVAKGEGCTNLNFPVWSMDYKHHYNWCRNVSEAEANKGSEQRASLLGQCRNRGAQGVIIRTVPAVDSTRITALSRQNSCQDYANIGISQQQQNLEMRCGFKGPEWNANYNDHFNWCMHGENLKHTPGAQQKRQDALDRCGATTPSPTLDPGVNRQTPRARQNQMQEEAIYVPPSRADLVRALLADPSMRKQIVALPQIRGRSPESLMSQSLDRTYVMGDTSSKTAAGFAPVGAKRSPADFNWRKGVTFTPFEVPFYLDRGKETPLGHWQFYNVKVIGPPHQVRLNAFRTKFNRYPKYYSPIAIKYGPERCKSIVGARCNCKCEGVNFRKEHPTWIVLSLFLPVAGTYVISINDNWPIPSSVHLNDLELKWGSNGANKAGLYLVTVSNNKLGRAKIKIKYNGNYLSSRFDGITVTRL